MLHTNLGKKMVKSSGKVFMLILCGVNSKTPRSKLFYFKHVFNQKLGKHCRIIVVGCYPVFVSLELKRETFSTIRRWIRKGLWPNQGVITPWSNHNAMAYPDYKTHQTHRATCGPCIRWDYITHLLDSITTVLWNIFFLLFLSFTLSYCNSNW